MKLRFIQKFELSGLDSPNFGKPKPLKLRALTNALINTLTNV